MSAASHKGVLHGTVTRRSDAGRLQRAGCRVHLDLSLQESRWKRHLGQIADSAAIRVSTVFNMPLGR
jgi:hypothetical protein